MSYKFKIKKIEATLRERGYYKKPTDDELEILQILYPEHNFDRETQVKLWKEEIINKFDRTLSKAREFFRAKSDEELEEDRLMEEERKKFIEKNYDV